MDPPGTPLDPPLEEVGSLPMRGHQGSHESPLDTRELAFGHSRVAFGHLRVSCETLASHS